jgi:NAD+ synthase
MGLLLPEKDSDPQSTLRGQEVADALRLPHLTQHIGDTLQAIGCYQWRDEAIRALCPDYGPGWASKIAIQGGQQGHINHFHLVVQAPDGHIQSHRLPHREYLQMVAATSFKQRIRKTLEYFHADRLHYAVVGTPNRLEYELGFFVKNGDGSADLKPIAHLYKTQVYALARYLGVPESVCQAAPSTDTYSMPQGQDEFFFTLPHAQMDLALWAFNQGLSPLDAAQHLHLPEAEVRHVYADIQAKRVAARYLHAPAQCLAPLTSRLGASLQKGGS